MGFLFDRVYRLVIGQSGAGGALEITQLRTAFTITKTTKKNPNSSRIQVWNLAKATRERLQKPGTRCELHAGYAEHLGPQLIFKGDVTFAWTKHDGPDIVTEFDLGDGVAPYRDTMVSLGYDKNVNSQTLLNDLARQMGTPLYLPDEAPSRTWENGISFHGPARSALDRVTRGSGLEWSIQNGLLQVLRAGGATTRGAIVIAADSGMVNSPERQRKGAEEPVQVNTTGSATRPRQRVNSYASEWDGWRVNSLLMPTLNPGDRIKLEAREVEGVMRIRELKHEGDTHGDNWNSELRVVDINVQAPRAGSPQRPILPPRPTRPRATR